MVAGKSGVGGGGSPSRLVMHAVPVAAISERQQNASNGMRRISSLRRNLVSDLSHLAVSVVGEYAVSAILSNLNPNPPKR